MISKVINWTVGSFFRTIGRLVALILIIVVVYFIGGCEVNADVMKVTCYTGTTCSRYNNTELAFSDTTYVYINAYGHNNATIKQGQTIFWINLVSTDVNWNYEKNYTVSFYFFTMMSDYITFMSLNGVPLDFEVKDKHIVEVKSSIPVGKWWNDSHTTSLNIYQLYVHFDNYTITGTTHFGVSKNWNMEKSADDSISDMEDSVNSNIDDMEQSIIDSNKETQDTIKDELNECRESNNLANSKNLSSYKHNGITFTPVYENGLLKYIEANGTATNVAYWDIAHNVYDSGSYILSGSPAGGSMDSYELRMLRITDYHAVGYDRGSGATFNMDGTTRYYIRLRIASGYTAENVRFYPMLRKASVGSNVYEAYGEEICKNRLDNVSDSVNDLNDSINNSDTSESGSAIEGFFSGFSSSDHGGISGIITAPLVAINKMLSGTCSSMTTTYKDKTISLPCGTDFWNKMGDLRDFYNLVVGGFLCYGMIIQLFKMIENLKNPDDDRVEVLDL